jgi:hypothetical protein
VDSLCRSGDGSLIRHVDLKGDGARTNLLCSDITTLEVARPHQDGETVCNELLCYLETDALIGSGDQGDAIGSWALITVAHGPRLTYAGRARCVAALRPQG